MSEIIVRTIDESVNETNSEIITITDQQSEKYMKYLVKTTFISCIRSKNLYIKYISYSFINLILFKS